MTTFDLFRRAGVPAAAVALLSLTACSGSSGATATATATVTVTAPASPAEPSGNSPEASQAPSTSDAPVPAATTPAPRKTEKAGPPITAATPDVFGETFQSDPGHDFTKGLSPSRDGVLRAQLVTMQDENVAEYRPIRFVPEVGGSTNGHFEGPPEGDVMAFAAPLAKGVVFLSAVGCKGDDQTINSRYVGTQRCPRDKLILRADAGDLRALITVQRGQIVKVVEIYAP
ncbi:hypothetical protein [Microbispora sp. H10949]|uniref:hypothetical protein n=1 Tax=Microbispora sp. H10949 TaxID=2729111 RepID=UPI001601DC26|nr:hypothetical protein [Microbispora sp. H10949]